MKRVAFLFCLIVCLFVGACQSVWSPFINYHDEDEIPPVVTGCPTGFCPQPSPTQVTLEGIWGSAFNDIWVIGSGCDFLHWDGGIWKKFLDHDSFQYGIWGSGPQDVWAVSNGWWHLGATGPWSLYQYETDVLFGIWGSGSQDVWATGQNGFLSHWDGRAWTRTPPPAGLEMVAFSPIWGSGPQDIWAATGNTMVHWDGSAWSVVASPAQYAISSIWGSGAQDVWAVSLEVIMHWNGTAWTAVTFPEEVFYTPFFGLWGSSQRDVWTVGRQGAIMHFDGTAWSIVQSGTTANLHAAWGDGRGNLWVIGEGGLILYHRYQPG